MKLLIAVPANGYIRFEFAQCLGELLLRLQAAGVDVSLHIEGGTLVYMAREKLAAYAINGGYDRVLWLDADMTFPPDLCDRLAPGLPFATSVYRQRRSPYGVTVYDSLFPVHRMEDLPEAGEPVRALACGFGGVLMETGLLRDVLDKCGCCFTPTTQFGEDIAFCARVHDNKLAPLMVCPSARMGHIGIVTVTPEWHP